MDSKITIPDISEDMPLQPVIDHVPSPPTVLPPAKSIPAPQRTFRITITSRNEASEIRFGGQYLEKFKFPIGTRLLVTVKKGRIVIRPHTYQPWLPKGVAREVREASANDDP